MFLDGFDIITGADGGDGVGVAQIVEPGFIQTDLFDDLLVIDVDSVGPEVLAQFIGKDEIRVFIAFAILQAVDELPVFHLLQGLHDEGSHSNGAALSVFRGGKSVFAMAAPNLLQLLIDGDGAFGQIHTIPGQPHGFGFAHSGEEGDGKQILKLVAADGLQECGDLVIVKGFDLLLFPPGEDAGIGGVGADVLIQHGLLQGTVKNAMDVLDGLGGGSVFLLRQLIVKALDCVGGEGVQTDGA